MRIYELRGKNFEADEHTVIRTLRAEPGILPLLTISGEYKEMYDEVWWTETRFENERIRDLGGYYQGL